MSIANSILRNPIRVAGKSATPREFAIRELSVQDVDLQRAFFENLSTESMTRRFMGTKREISDHLLQRLCRIDQIRHVAFMAETIRAGGPVMIAEARYLLAEDDPERCEFALSVADGWQRRGIAGTLLARLECRATAGGVRLMTAETLSDNEAMLSLARRTGYAICLNMHDARALRLQKPLIRPGLAIAA